MGIFSRMTDIINSNINSMLEKAEDPEKMIRLMTQEMEETLVDIKSQAAGVMARLEYEKRSLAEIDKRIAVWHERAKLALAAGDEALAREAIGKKTEVAAHREQVAGQVAETEEAAEHFKRDICRLNEKLVEAKARRNSLIARARAADASGEVDEKLRRAESIDVIARFEKIEKKILEKEMLAGLESPEDGIEEKFARMEKEKTISHELDKLKRELGQNG